jgi:hypothetical protein
VNALACMEGASVVEADRPHSTRTRSANRAGAGWFRVVSSLDRMRTIFVRAHQESEGGVSARALAPGRGFPRRDSMALAGDAADRPRRQVKRGTGPASGAGLMPDQSCQVGEEAGNDQQGDPAPRRGTETIRCPVSVDASSEGERFGSTWPDGQWRNPRVESAHLETPARPRAPGKTGSPVEITRAARSHDETAVSS